MVARTSFNLAARSSAWETGVGNLPALERPGPNNLHKHNQRLDNREKQRRLVRIPRDLLDQDFGGDKSIVLFSQFLDQFLVLVHLFEVINTHDVDPKLLCSVNIVGIAEDADGHLGSGDVGQFDLAGETLVSEDISHLQQKETGSVG